jgi:8-oxo-dGTP pyrophosphatase MutT (NUDIX family)
VKDTATIDDIAAALVGRCAQSADPGPQGHAAVAIILHAAVAAEPRVLIIERAPYDGDPWSGDLAFPGGRLEPDDADARAAAERETLEEVGLDLADARMLGRLDDRAARVLPLMVSAFVYAILTPPELQLSDEVSDACWVPVAHLVDPNRQCEHHQHGEAEVHRYPAVDLFGPRKPLLWGVTYFFLCALLREVGHELPLSTPA